MLKDNYRFNTKTLSVEKVQETIWDKIKKILRIALAGVVFSIIVLIIGYTFFESPREQMLLREIEQYEFQHEIIHDRLNKLAAVLDDIQYRDDNIYRVIFEADPIPFSVREAGYGGADRYLELEGFDNTELIRDLHQRIDKLARQLYVQSKSYDEVFEMAKNKADMLASIPAIIPIERGIERVISGFGYRIHPIYKTMRMHTGVDFSAPTGTPIYATGNGIITKAGRNRHGYGIMVRIDHGYGYKTLYAHMSKINVRQGQQVQRGEIIGYVGNTGISTAPHLHYEVIRNGKKVDPVSYFYNDLTPEEFEYIIEKASRVNQSLS